VAHFAATLLEAILNAFISFFLQKLNIYLLITTHIIAFYKTWQVTHRYLQNSDMPTQIRQDLWERVDPDPRVRDPQVFSGR
jgi:hypothetical protein